MRIGCPEWSFQFAHEADPNAKLIYNDYNLAKPGKTERANKMLKMLLQAGTPSDNLRMQGHRSIFCPMNIYLSNH